MDRNTAKEKILLLKLENPTWGASTIAKFLSISENFVNNILYPRKKDFQHLKNQKRHPYAAKRKKFRSGYSLLEQEKDFFSLLELKNKIGESPVCQLTGWEIKKENTSDYHFDHKIPRSNGGDCSLSNLQVLCDMANRAKGESSNEEVIKFAKAVCENNGYMVIKI